jgi:DNA polymerase-1
MVMPAFTGTHPHPGIPGATMTAGRDHLLPWLQQHLSRSRDLASDIETYGVDLDGFRIKCVVLGVPEAAFVADPRDLAQAALIRKAHSYARTVIHHKANFDAPSLVLNGLMHPQTVDNVVCTMVKARMATPGKTVRRTLDACAKRYLGMDTEHTIGEMFKTLGLTKDQGYQRLDIDSPAYLMGAAADGIVTARVAPLLHQACLDLLLRGHPFTEWAITDPAEAEWEIEKHQLVNRWGIRRTIKGLVANLEYLDGYLAQYGAARDRGAAELAALGIDPGNGNHLIRYLSDQGLIEPDHPRTPVKTNPKTGKVSGGTLKSDQKTVALIQHPAARAFAAVKERDKIIGYLDKVKGQAVIDGRVRPTLEVLAAVHGRSSMTGIEIHQFPAGARPIIGADPGDDLTSVDWSAQEPMLGMNFAGDTGAIAAYERGERIYTYISQLTGVADKPAKVILLGGMYGEGAKELTSKLGMDPGPYWTKDDGTVIASYKQAKELQKATWAALPRTWDFLERMKKVAGQYQMVMTMNGRVVPIASGPRPWDGVWSVQVHKGGNGVICGSAADMMTDVVVMCIQQGISDQVYFNMHDEFVTSSGVAHQVQQNMQNVSARLQRAAGRVPLIRTDLERLGSHWKGEEK